MAAGTLPKPGSKYGPCRKACAHEDCAASRMMAAERCRCCLELIGYDQRFYQERDPDGLVHAVCLEDEVDAAAKTIARHR